MNLSNDQIEKNVLTSIVHRPRMLIEAKSNLTSDAFYTPVHRVIFDKIKEIHSEGIPCDSDTLIARFSMDTNTEAVEVIQSFKEEYPVEAYFEGWCRTLMDLRARRTILSTARGLIDQVERSDKYADVSIDSAKSIGRAVDLSAHKAVIDNRGSILQSIEFFEGVNKHPERFLVPYCLPGFEFEMHHSRKQIHVLGAPPNTGKTGFALSTLEAQTANGIRHAIFCNETPKRDLMNRLIVMRASIRTNDIYDLAVNASLMAKVKASCESLMAQHELFRIYGAGDYEHSVEGICGALESMIDGGYRPDMVTIDYLQNLKAGTHLHRAGRVEQLDTMILELSRFFKAEDLAGLWLSQINRDKDRLNSNREFTIYDLKGSSAIEQEADFITFIQRVRPADDNGITTLNWYSRKMRESHTIRCELGFDLGNGRILGRKTD